MKYLVKGAVVAAAVAAAAIPAGAANAATLIINLNNVNSFAARGNAANVVQTYLLGAGAHVTNVAFNVTLEAFSPSWLSEMGFAFTDSTPITDGVLLRPGIGVDSAGVATYTGSTDLVSSGLDFFLKPDGILRTEFYEVVNDSAVSPDGVWRSGTITLTYQAAAGAVPEPATWALMLLGFGAIGGALRSRRTTLRVRYT